MRKKPQQIKWNIGPYVIEFHGSRRFEGLPRYSLDVLIGNCLVNVGWYTAYERAIHALGIHAEWYFGKREVQREAGSI